MMTMKKMAALFLALLMCVFLAFPANAATEYPPRPSGTVADLAGVLGEKLIQDMETLSSRLESATGGHIFVLTRHFLGGAAVQQYADQVFKVWSLTDQDALVLMVIGEESYALSLGKSAKAALPNETQTQLLGAFRTKYLNRDYDQALADLSLDIARSLSKASGASLATDGLFGIAAIQSTPQPETSSSSDWWNGMFAQNDYDAAESDDRQIWEDWQNEWRYEETRINWRSVIIWALVIYFLFFRKKKRRARR